ncbi:hypothetical protein [Geminicoccus flavidas]|uniref:hypothetical protein n=1 Tax=Geminicoccus flavidas TaxID=2506407 RepID=UPI001359F467|nr:hypothetical protein [Geminicoccus flavidas]
MRFWMWLLAILALAGCARTGVLLKNPNQLDVALIDAATNAASMQFTGQNYYDFLYPTRQEFTVPIPLPGEYPTELCTAAQVEQEGLVDRTCIIGRPASYGLQLKMDCANIKGCAAIRVSPSILQDPPMRALVFQALRRPCDYLPDPRQIAHKPMGAIDIHVWPLALSAGNAYGLLGCHGWWPPTNTIREIVGDIIVVDLG